jgi:lysophospholipase L1-like esterase
LTDVRIAEGLKVSLRAIQAMHDLATAQRIKLIVVLIPTKEYVFRDVQHKLSKDYAVLVENEEQLWREAKDYFDHHGIEYVDALPALHEELANHIQPYPSTQDGHPNHRGHRAIAQAVASIVRRISSDRGQSQ